MADASVMRAALVGIDFGTGDFKASLEELALLGKIEATQDKISTIAESVVRPRGGQL